jgi:excisionase family DNA binding protein
MSPPTLVSVDHAAKALNLPRETIEKYVRLGYLPLVKLGTRRLILYAELQKLATHGLTQKQHGARRVRCD